MKRSVWKALGDGRSVGTTLKVYAFKRQLFYSALSQLFQQLRVEMFRTDTSVNMKTGSGIDG